MTERVEARSRGWNPTPPPTLHYQGEDLEAMLFTGENFPDICTFLRGLAYRLGPDAFLIDAPDRALLVRVGDVVLRYPNGTVSRHRPSQAVKP